MCVCVCVCVCDKVYLPSPSQELDARQGPFLKMNLTGLNSEFPLPSCHSKVIRLGLSYYLPITLGRKVGFILF